MRSVIFAIGLLSSVSMCHAQNVVVAPVFDFRVSGLYDLESKTADGYWLEVETERIIGRNEDGIFKSASEDEIVCTGVLFRFKYSANGRVETRSDPEVEERIAVMEERATRGLYSVPVMEHLRSYYRIPDAVKETKASPIEDQVVLCGMLRDLVRSDFIYRIGSVVPYDERRQHPGGWAEWMEGQTGPLTWHLMSRSYPHREGPDDEIEEQKIVFNDRYEYVYRVSGTSIGYGSSNPYQIHIEDTGTNAVVLVSLAVCSGNQGYDTTTLAFDYAELTEGTE